MYNFSPYPQRAQQQPTYPPNDQSIQYHHMMNNQHTNPSNSQSNNQSNNQSHIQDHVSSGLTPTAPIRELSGLSALLRDDDMNQLINHSPLPTGHSSQSMNLNQSMNHHHVSYDMYGRYQSMGHQSINQHSNQSIGYPNFYPSHDHYAQMNPLQNSTVSSSENHTYHPGHPAHPAHTHPDHQSNNNSINTASNGINKLLPSNPLPTNLPITDVQSKNRLEEEKLKKQSKKRKHFKSSETKPEINDQTSNSSVSKGDRSSADPSANQSTNKQSSSQSISQSTKSSNKNSDGQPKSQKRKCKIACTGCHVAKTSCDGQRPCGRCVRLNKQSTCEDRPSKLLNSYQSIKGMSTMLPLGFLDPSTFHFSSMNQSINQSMPLAIIQTPQGPVTYVPLNHTINQSVTQATEQSTNPSTPSPLNLHDVQSSHNQPSDPISIDDESDVESDEDDDQPGAHSLNQPNDQSIEQSSSDSDSEFDIHSFSLFEPSFHRSISKNMRRAHLRWMHEQSMNQSINQSINQSNDPYAHVSLLGKLVYLTWLQSMFHPGDLATVLHEAGRRNNNTLEDPLIKEELASMQSNDLSGNPFNQPGSSCNQTSDQSNKRSDNHQECPGFGMKPSPSLESLDSNDSSHSTSHSNQSTDSSSTQSIERLPTTLSDVQMRDFSNNDSSAKQASQQSNFQSGRSSRSSGECNGSSCNYFCTGVRAWADSNPCVFSYAESPLQPISQSINPSTNQPNNVPTSLVEFDYPLLIESMLNREDLSSEAATRRLLLNTMKQSKMKPGPPTTGYPFNLTTNKFRSPDVIQVRLSVTVNSSFERMFGYSQSEIRSQSIKHGSKSFYALIRPDCWEEIMYAEQEATFGRTHEYMLYVMCVTKWKGEVYCLKHTKHVYDDEGRYKESRTHFIPLPDKKCPPYGSGHKSGKHADKSIKTKKRNV